MTSPSLRVHRFLPRTRANGPGLRAALWVQGCSLECPGCFNPGTHERGRGEIMPIAELVARIAAIPDIEGITISGGEPLQQRRGVLALLRTLEAEGDLSVLLFTGYTPEEVRRMPEGEAILGLVDVLIAGRYDATQRLARGLRGSRNKTVTFVTTRYGQADLDAVPPCEVVVGPGGTLDISGIDPPRW